MKVHIQNMKSFLTFMNLFLVAVIFLSVLASHQASAAFCSEQTSFKCQVSDYTLDSCSKTELVCACKTDYMPIPTGCTSKLVTPTVTYGVGRTNQFVPGTTVKLTCSTSESGTLVFEWRKNGITMSNEISKDLLLKDDDKNKVGKFSCRVTDTALNVTSDLSAEKEIVTLDAASVIPVVTVAPLPSAAPGAPLDIQCTNIPLGATYKFKIDSSTTTVDTVTQNSANKNVQCVLDSAAGVTYGTTESTAVALPTDANDITAAAITSTVATTIIPATDFTLKTGTPVIFTCLTTPDAKYMAVGAKTIAYTFKDSGAAPSPAGNVYNMTSTPGNNTTRTVTCTAKYTAGVDWTSPTVTVRFSDTYIKTPALNASLPNVPPGSPLILTCGEPQLAVRYTWTKDGKPIARETERVIQFGSFKPADAGKFVCTAAKDYYSVSSNEFDVKSRAQELRVLGSTVTVLIAVISCMLF